MAPNNNHHHNLLLLLLLLLQFLLFFSAPTAAGKASALIVFGDSTVDTGNNNQIATVLKSNFRPYGRDFIGGEPTGRFCNGRLATDFIGEGLGLGLTVPAYLDPAYGIADFATHVCFASAGTGLDNATSNVLAVIPLWKEVEYFRDYLKKLRRYLGKAEAQQRVHEAVYIISIGTNDFLENYFALVTGRVMQFTIEQFEDFLVGLAADFITEIYRLGARNIVYTGLTAIGCLPLERTTNFIRGGECIEEYNEVAKDFNVKLMAMIDERNAALPGIKLRFNNVYDPFLGIIRDPSSYGIENVSQGCCATGTYEMGFLCNEQSPFTCTDADKYVFWDSFHPTEKVNRLMANLTLHSCLSDFL